MARRVIKILLISLVSMAAIAVGIALVVRSHEQRLNEQAAAIHTRNGIQESMYVTIGGIRQWVQISGEDRDNPVLLFLHGGPGASALPLTLGWRPWAKYFTVVQWDQRGAGRTYRKNGEAEAGTINLPTMTRDGIELTEFLRAHLHKDKILLVGHSWGSILGIYMVKQRPEYFSAYVGTGQVVSARENEEFNYAHVLAQARVAHNDVALAALARLGPPPWAKLEQLVEERKWANKLAVRSGDGLNPRASFSAPGLSVIDYYYWVRGPRFSARQIGMAPSSFDLRSLGLDFELPVFFFEGTADQFTPIEPAEQYFQEIRAPHKELVRFEGDHHFVIFNRPDEFLGELRLKVLPQLRK